MFITSCQLWIVNENGLVIGMRSTSISYYVNKPVTGQLKLKADPFLIQHVRINK